MNREITVGYAGMTHLGICHSIGSAYMGIRTIGYDHNPELINEIRSGDLKISEPNLNDMLKKSEGLISFSAEKEKLADCDIVFISSDVPTDDDGKSSLEEIRKLIDQVSNIINKRALLVILCQVPPGFSRGVKLDKVRLFYQVETLIFGKAMDRVLNPERIIIGADHSSVVIPEVYKDFLDRFKCPTLVMKYESAELAKISINFFLVSSVTTSNILAEVCEHIGADWNEIIPALRLDKRIGKFAYLKPGLGISGGNLERDLATVKKLSNENRFTTPVVDEWIRNSRYRKDWLFNCFTSKVLPNFASKEPSLALLGLAYKENTHSIKNSPSVNFLKKANLQHIKVHDPEVPWGNNVKYKRVENVKECIDESDVLIVATPWEEYQQISADELLKLMKTKYILDPYRILDGSKLTELGFQYFTLGK